MIRIAIVDDDKNTEEMIGKYIERYADSCGKKIETMSFSDGDEFVETYNLEYDIILMDVQMKFMDGITASKLIRERDPDVVIVFITNMAQYAVRGYEVNALDYVIKPIEYFSFSEKLSRAIGQTKKKEKNYIIISVNRGLKKLDVSQICYIESYGHKLIFHMTSKEYTTHSITMKELEEKLEKYHFYRCNKGYLVNLEYVEGIKDNYAVIGGEKILISRLKKNAFLEALTNFVGNGRN